MNQHIRPLPTRPSSILILLVGLLAASHAAAAEVWIVVDGRNPVHGPTAAARVIEIDAPQRIEEELSAQLPADPQQAAAQFRTRLEQGGQDQPQRMREAYQGVVDAWSLGVTKVPAVVVDRRYVVYGEASLDKALGLIARQRGEQP